MKDVNIEVTSITGDEFFGTKDFVKFDEDDGVTVYHDIAKDDHLSKYGSKLGIIDRLVKTLKGYITKIMLETRSTKWTNLLDDVIELYITTPHTSL